MDISPLGLKKAQQLATDEGVKIKTICRDLEAFDMGEGAWDAIVSIFMPIMPDLRRTVYDKVRQGLKSGGYFVMEMYRPKQLEYGTGGPPVLEMLINETTIRDELKDLTYEILAEKDREILEGTAHTGKSAVVQLLAKK